MNAEKHKILVVDDEMEILQLMEKIIRGLGYEAVTADNGLEAIDRLKENMPVSVIVSDYRMPKMQGTDFIREAKNIAPFAPRIMVTAHQDTHMMQDAINRGEVYKFLTKPIEVADIEKILQDAVAKYEKVAEENKRMAELTLAVRGKMAELGKLESELVQAGKKAQDATQARQAFLASMTHELRIPLNAILGYSQLLMGMAEEKGVTEDFVPELNKVQAYGKDLLDLVNGLLGMSEGEPGKRETGVEHFAVRPMVEETISFIAPFAKKNGNRLEFQVDPGAKFMEADRKKVFQVLVNVLKNACKYTKNGKVSLVVQTEKKDEAEYVVFKIADTGIGMTQEQVEAFFDATIEADSSRKKFPRAGLKLTISRLFCRMMGGDIEVESEFGKGTTFTVRALKSPPISG
ncbi:MAG: hybrid sensor histidine kinase/response regulator [Nitrospinae bacterium]|nr:hybrid sensor histidine kinase/response regulator [Nitrospinota bacterium]